VPIGLIAQREADTSWQLYGVDSSLWLRHPFQRILIEYMGESESLGLTRVLQEGVNFRRRPKPMKSQKDDKPEVVGLTMRKPFKRHAKIPSHKTHAIPRPFARVIMQQLLDEVDVGEDHASTAVSLELQRI